MKKFDVIFYVILLLVGSYFLYDKHFNKVIETTNDDMYMGEKIVHDVSEFNPFKDRTKILDTYLNKDIYSNKSLRRVDIDKDDCFIMVLDYLYNNDRFGKVTTKYKFDKSLKGKKLEIDVSEVTSNYENLFGTKVELRNVSSFYADYIYDKKNNKVYSIEKEFNLGDKLYISYIDEVTKINRDYYVYVYVGYIVFRVDGIVTVYEDIDDNRVYKAFKNGEYTKENYNDAINKNNYKLFSKYKYFYKIDEDGRYYFEKIEKLS